MRVLVSRVVLLAVLAAAMLGPLPASPATPPDLESLFPHRAELVVEGAGLARLALPTEVLVASRADLSDLRILAAGREVPYLIDSGLPPESWLKAEKRIELEIVGAERHTVEQTSAPDLLTEIYRLAIPAAAREGESWDLVLDGGPRDYVREIRVVARSEEGGARVLVDKASVFRFSGSRQEKGRALLPPLDAETLEVTLSGESGRFLGPSFALETSRTLAKGEQTAVTLEIVGRGVTHDGRSRIELLRPRGLVPDLIRIATSTGSFQRRVEVWDDGPGSEDEPLGVSKLIRLETVAGVESLEMSVHPARGDRLRLVIADGDSPPLEDLRVIAVVRRPALLFSMPALDGPQGAALLFGGARAYRPSYDLSGLLPPRPRRVSGERALIAGQLYDSTALAHATLGSIVDNPVFDPTPALTFAMEPGAEIDTRPYQYRVPLKARDAPEGLFRLRLAPELTSRARPDLGDLRIVDSEERQRAYLLEPDAGRTELPIALGRARTQDGTSSYALPLPVAPLEVDEVALDSDKEFFDRAYELVGTLADQERGEAVLAQGRLVRRPGDPRKLRIVSSRELVTSLELRVVDSDDAPLSFRNVSVIASAADLYFASPGGEYSLLFGNPEETSPNYELVRVRNLVLAVESAEAVAGGVEENSTFSAGSRLASGSGLQQVLLWVALALAVIVLAWFTLRLSRAQDT